MLPVVNSVKKRLYVHNLRLYYWESHLYRGGICYVLIPLYCTWCCVSWYFSRKSNARREASSTGNFVL